MDRICWFEKQVHCGLNGRRIDIFLLAVLGLRLEEALLHSILVLFEMSVCHYGYMYEKYENSIITTT